MPPRKGATIRSKGASWRLRAAKPSTGISDESNEHGAGTAQSAAAKSVLLVRMSARAVFHELLGLIRNFFGEDLDLVRPLLRRIRHFV
jgi:hypothetical protein